MPDCAPSQPFPPIIPPHLSPPRLYHAPPLPGRRDSTVPAIDLAHGLFTRPGSSPCPVRPAFRPVAAASPGGSRSSAFAGPLSWCESRQSTVHAQAKTANGMGAAVPTHQACSCRCTKAKSLPAALTWRLRSQLQHLGSPLRHAPARPRPQDSHVFHPSQPRSARAQTFQAPRQRIESASATRGYLRCWPSSFLSFEYSA